MLPEGCHEEGVAHGAGLLAQDAQQAGGKERYAAVKTAQAAQVTSMVLAASMCVTTAQLAWECVPGASKGSTCSKAKWSLPSTFTMGMDLF